MLNYEKRRTQKNSMTPTALNPRAPDRAPLDIPLPQWLITRTFWPICILVGSRIPVNNWFGGADHDVSEDFVADRRHDLRIRRLWRGAFCWGTTSGIDAQFFGLRVRAPQHVLKVQIGIATISHLVTCVLFESFNYVEATRECPSN